MSFILRSFVQFKHASLPNIIFGRLDFDFFDVSEEDFKHYGIFYPDFLKSCVSKRKAEYLAGRLCAKNLFHIVGLPDSKLQLLPRPDRLPDWPNEFIGSISHTSDCAVVCLTNDSNYKNLGVDIESIMTNETAHLIASTVSTIDERIKFSSLIDFQILLTLIFSIKESVYKAIYIEIKKILDFDALTIIDVDLQNLKFTVKLNYTLNEKYAKDFILSGDFILNFGEGKVFSVVAK